MVFSKEIKPGHFITADSIIYKDFTDNMMKQYTLVRQEEKMVQGYPALKITGRNILQPAFYMQAVNFLQNGRNVIVMAITDSVHLHSPAIDSIFETPATGFRMLRLTGSYRKQQTGDSAAMRLRLCNLICTAPITRNNFIRMIPLHLLLTAFCQIRSINISGQKTTAVTGKV